MAEGLTYEQKERFDAWLDEPLEGWQAVSRKVMRRIGVVRV